MMRSHLSDDRLIELCMLDAPALAEQQHLSACARCDARRVGLQRLLDDALSAVDTGTEARILAHLQHEGRPGRLIAFPAGHAPHESSVSRTRPGSRWIAAAAVAGLVVGLIAGRFGHDYSFGRPGPARVIIARTAEQPELRATASTAAIREVTASISDEEFLNQIEIAIDAPAAAALQPLDDLTPRAWEVR